MVLEDQVISRSNGDTVVMLLGAARMNRASLAIKQTKQQKIRYLIWESVEVRSQEGRDT